LDLGSNYLTNPDHSRLFPMPALEHMSVSRNKFNGSFPQFILSCTNLKFLDLSKNAFCGYQTCWPR
jgi:Leucine-rich repeat (LRR) protein